MVATYRLQLQPDFGFAEVERLVPYLKQLGISHLYLSPINAARAGSTHGYDVIDHNTIREDLGGREDFERLLETTHAHGMELIIDFVPNHAGVGPDNSYWQDVLAYGHYAAHADYFDIDWSPLKPELQGRILLPFLGRPYGEVFDDGEIILTFEGGRFYAAYYDHRFAISPHTYADILHALLPDLERTDPYWDLKELAESYERLLPDEREKAEALGSRLQQIAERSGLSDVGEAVTGMDLHALLERQHWRLAYWKTAGAEINYRRFFDINGLVALRMEDEAVFWDAHRLLSELLVQEGVAGVRIDHIDGLYDPHQYLDRLREAGARHIWVEKIMAPGETLPEEWPVEGATGYTFMNDLMGVLLHPSGKEPLSRTYRRLVPDAPSFAEEVYQSKKLIMRTTLSSELHRLAYELDRISEADYHTRDFTLEALRSALREVIAAFDRYRTYLPYEKEEAQELIREIIHRARQQAPSGEPTVYDFIADVILGNVREDLQAERRAWVGRLQQYTAPVAAKGVEDTAFYRYHRLVALNEVGGEPDRFGQSDHAFHAHSRFRKHTFPRTLLSTATHDHKRGEDTRMRLIALAELPERWETTALALDEIAQDYFQEAGPSEADAYLFYQILVALWHDTERTELKERLWTYMEKAARESKLQTNWVNPDTDYEDALETFVHGLIDDERTDEVLEPLSSDLARHGFYNSMSQLVLKTTSPGVPDFYQGCELLDLSLVDPDNRRPVDYKKRQNLLDELGSLLDDPEPEPLGNFLNAQDPKLKCYLTAQLLRLRRSHAALFEKGDYLALEPGEPEDAPWIGFARTHENVTLITLASRYPSQQPSPTSIPLPEELSSLRWQEVLTGTAISPGDTLNTDAFPLPWAVLLATDLAPPEA